MEQARDDIHTQVRNVAKIAGDIDEWLRQPVAILSTLGKDSRIGALRSAIVELDFSASTIETEVKAIGDTADARLRNLRSAKLDAIDSKREDVEATREQLSIITSSSPTLLTQLRSNLDAAEDALASDEAQARSEIDEIVSSTHSALDTVCESMIMGQRNCIQDLLSSFDKCIQTRDSDADSGPLTPRARLRAHSRNASYSFSPANQDVDIKLSSSMKKAAGAQIWAEKREDYNDEDSCDEDGELALNESSLSVKSAPDPESDMMASPLSSAAKHMTVGPMSQLATGLRVEKTPSKPVPRLWNIFGELEREVSEEDIGDDDNCTEDDAGLRPRTNSLALMWDDAASTLHTSLYRTALD